MKASKLEITVLIGLSVLAGTLTFFHNDIKSFMYKQIKPYIEGKVYK